MWWRKHGSKVAGGLIALWAAVWSIGLGWVELFDWDEVNFAECAREMRASGEYLYAQIGFLPFWEKPPLFFWLQALSMELWGENAWGSRFPNVIVSVLTLALLFLLGKRWHGPAFGVVWVGLHGMALLPSFYARSGLIDPLFNLWMLGATVAGVEVLRKRDWRYGMAFGLLAGLATLTKGPVGLLMPSLAVGTVAIAARRWKGLFRIVLFGGGAYALLVGSWIALLAIKGSIHLLKDFWAYQWRLFATADAGHGGPWYYHFVVVGAGMFPASVFAVGLVPLRRQLKRIPFPAWGVLALGAWTLVVFSLVRTKILHYSSLSYYTVSYVGAWVWQQRRAKGQQSFWTATAIGGLLLGLLTVAAGLLLYHWRSWIGSIQDPFVRAALESQPVQWSGIEGWPGLVLLVGVGLMGVLPLSALGRLLLLGMSLQVWQLATLSVFAWRAEAYSQKPLREFCQEKAREGAILWPVGFKSYIPFFYGRMPLQASPRQVGSLEEFARQLLAGEAPFPVYFVSRVDRYEPFVQVHRLEVIARRGGYVLLGLPNLAPQPAQGKESP